MTEYISRRQWGARHPSGGRNSINSKPLGVAVHWNGPGCASSIEDHKDCAGFVRGIQNYHMFTKGWSDIAYTMFACPHGYLYEGRGEGVGTAANGTTWGNDNYYAIYAMWGEGDGNVPEDMLTALADGIAMIHGWDGTGDAITTHDALFSTECPGDELRGLVADGRFEEGGKPKRGGGAQSVKPKPKRKPKAPAFPLPSGHWYGVESSDPRNHSGYWKKDRDGIRTWQSQMLTERGWGGIGAIDGIFGEKSETVARQFQQEKGLAVDGLVGPQTWKTSWTADIT